MRLRLLLIATFLMVAPAAFSASFSLNDWCFYVNTLDITRSCNDGAGADNFNPPTISSTTFDYHVGDNNQLGTVVVTLGAGTYNIFAIFNYDINSPDDPTESASVHGIPVGQVYSVDAEGDSNGFSGGTGSLYSQFAGGTLDNTNHCDTGCSDVAVSLGYQNLEVPEGSTGSISFVVSDTPPTSGFYVQQSDGSGSDLFFSTTSELVASPEPGTVILMTGGIALMLLGLKRKKKKA